MPERARSLPFRRTRRFAAEGLTVKKVIAAVLLGATLGLFASVLRSASQSRSRSLLEADRAKALTNWQNSQQANLLSDEKHRRELAEQARRVETTQLKKDLQHARAMAEAAGHDRDSAVAQASQAQTHLDQLSGTVQQLVQSNAQAAREAEEAKLEAQEAIRRAHRATAKFKVGVGMSDDRHALIRTVADPKASNPKLAVLLQKVSINQEVLVGVCASTDTTAHSLMTPWDEALRHAKVHNALVAALDPDCLRLAEKLGLAAFQASPEVAAGAAAKFQIVKEILQLGFAVLLADLDVVTLQDPFRHLHRDADVEAASDGVSNATAYGKVGREPEDSPSSGALAAQMTGLDPGLFYMRPTRASLDVLDLITSRLLKLPKSNPKVAFNEAILIPTSIQHTSPRAHIRVLDYMDFMNSRFLFAHIKGNILLESHRPIMVHLSFHTDKVPRMHAIIARYVHQKRQALSGFS